MRTPSYTWTAQRERKRKAVACAELALLLALVIRWFIGATLLPALVAEPTLKKVRLVREAWTVCSATALERSELRRSRASLCLLSAVPEYNMDRRDRDTTPSWNGEAAGWNDYVRRVRLHWERTAPRKRKQLGAELASRLTGRAWEILGDLDHGRLQQREGAAYLLEYLEVRLARSPIPDLGSRLEEFLVRLRRQPGARMIQWSTELRESYRRLQRALAKARGDRSPTKSTTRRTAPTGTTPKAASPKSSAAGSGLPIERRRSDTTAEPEPQADLEPVHPGDTLDEHLPVADERSHRGGEGWTAEEWEAWWNGQTWDSPSRRWRFGGSWWDKGKDDSDDDDGPTPEWERFQLDEIDALPSEVLGWLLLRRAGLPSHARLSVLAATNNRLDLDLVEKALRDQEEDLLQAEDRRGPRRTFWVEQEGSWGLLLDEPAVEESQGTIHWVGDRLPEEVHPVFATTAEEEDTWCTYHGDSEVNWVLYESEWWTEDPEGIWWNWSDAKPWLEVNEAMVLDPSAGKEMQEALTLYQDRARTFRESRQLIAAKNTARGFYPMSAKGSKGKGKGKGKSHFSGKGRGKKGSPPASPSSSSTALAAESSKGSQRPGNPAYTGCFICGSRDHDFRRCPKRGAGKGGAAHAVTDGSWQDPTAFMVQGIPDGAADMQPELATDLPPELATDLQPELATDLQPELATDLQPELATDLLPELVVNQPWVYMVQPGLSSVAPEDTIEPPEQPLCYMHVVDGRPSEDTAFGNFGMEAVMGVAGQLHPGFAVIDSGATETVGSLEAIEAVVSMRKRRYGLENVRVYPEAKRSFRFGNAQQETATSFVEVPQTLGGRSISLGVFALDVPRIPILLSIRTLKKLGAEINFQRRTIVFKAIDPGVTIALQESASGHLLLDLVHDWMRTPSAQQSFSGTVLSQVLPAYKEGERVLNLAEMLKVMNNQWWCRVQVQSRLSCRVPVLRTPEPLDGQSLAPAAKGKNAPKAKAKTKGEKVKTEYDVSRSVGPDPRDPRTAGGPCHGNHVPMKPGRGSLSGANAHGRWEVCEHCRLRLLYVPAFGSHAHYRQAGPLPVDAKKAVEIMEERVAAGKPAAKETLNAKAVALQGAEDSLLRRLETVRSQKAKVLGNKQDTEPNEDHEHAKPIKGNTTEVRDGYPKDKGARPKSKGTAPPPMVESSSEESEMDAENEPQRLPKKTQKRERRPRGMNVDADGYLEIEGVLEGEQVAAIRDSVSGILSAFDADVAELPKSRAGIHLLEVGTSRASGLRQAISDRRGEASHMSPFEFDFERKVGADRALSYADALAPRLLWVSLPCAALESPGDEDPTQTDDQRRTEMYRRKRCRKALKTGLRLAESQLDRGNHLVWEWPRNSPAWKEPEVRKFLGKMAKKGIMNAVVYDDREAGKSWRLVTTSPELRRMVEMARPAPDSRSRRSPASMSRSLSVSSRYPIKLCRAVAEFAVNVGEWSEQKHMDQVFGLSEEPLLETKLSPADRKRAEALVHRLHVRAGHPSGRTLAKVLRARGAHQEVVKIALEHQCADCQEMRLPDLAPSVSLQQSEVPWKVIQIDNAELRVDDVVTHFMVITDEATHFTVVAKLFDRPHHEGRNATAEEAILAIEQHWTQAYGFPDRIRCDPEGCFRSKLLESWCADLGIEITPCPAEAHHQIGQVESMVKKVKQDAITLLAGHPVGAHRALLHSAAAHNTVHRVQGFSPAQWAFGRDFGVDGRLFESEQGLPLVQNATDPGHSFHDHLAVRQAAEDVARKSQASYQLGRLLNMKSRRKVQFVPGDLVFYRRVQPPSDTPAHPGLGFAKVGQGRWFGPARVLASETRSDAQGMNRRPTQTVWIVANGRLKRCSPDQLRHASEREAAIAEATDAATPPWTFHSLLQTLEGSGFETFDDYVFPEDIGILPQLPRSRSRVRSRTPGREQPEKRERSAQNPAPRAPVSAAPMELESEARQREKRERSVQNPAPRTPGSSSTPLPVVDQYRYLGDPSYDPTLFRFLMDQQAQEAAQSAPLFKKSKPPPPKSRATPKGSRSSQDPGPVQFAEHDGGLYEGTEFPAEAFVHVEPEESIMCAIELPVPEGENQWKRMRRDPTAWMAKGLRKQEVRYGKLDEKGRESFDAAKQAEVNQWIREAAARKIQGTVSKDRIMSMRWVLTWKDSGAAKARIVIVGYQDPDLGSLVSSSPTMSRRTRQLLYQQSTLRSWKTMKADVRAAFLQTAPTQMSRCVFARPVPELAKAMQLKEGECVQIAKACYGLVNAPAEWFRDISRTLTSLGMVQLKTEPCCWKFVKWENGVPRLVGLIAAHVDDFIITGDESDSDWVAIVGRFYQSYRWSPWEVVDYNHCGVAVREGHKEVIMDQAKYCAQIDEIKFKARGDEELATPDEVSQLRAALGALQWRAYSTAPQLLVQLSMLQSSVNKATVKVLKQTNKLVREAFHGRFLHMKVTDLDGISPEQVTFVAWADAAVGNRPDHGSTGGYMICASTPAILKGDMAAVTPISWRSARLKRVARSSLAAETQAASEAEEELMLIRMQWKEMLGYEVNLQKPGEEIASIPGVLVTDAKSLYDVLRKEDLNSAAGGLHEKYSALELLSLSERVREGRTEIRCAMRTPSYTWTAQRERKRRCVFLSTVREYPSVGWSVVSAMLCGATKSEGNFKTLSERVIELTEYRASLSKLISQAGPVPQCQQTRLKVRSAAETSMVCLTGFGASGKLKLQQRARLYRQKAAFQPSVMERGPPAEPEDQGRDVADMEAVQLASADDVQQGPAEDAMAVWRSRHRQCMNILVREEWEQERRMEQLREMTDKLREETERRIEAEDKVKSLIGVLDSIGRGTRMEELELKVASLSVKSHVLEENAKKHKEQIRAIVEEKNELKRRYGELLTDNDRLLEENASLKQKCENQYKQLEELHLERLREGLKTMLEIQGIDYEDTFTSRPDADPVLEEAAEGSSVLSSAEQPNNTDQEGSDSVPTPQIHLPEPVDPTLHTGVHFRGKTAEQHRMEDEESLQETAIGSSREEAAEESSILSSEEVPHIMDQEGPDSVPTPLNHLPAPLDPTLHTGVNLLSSSFLPFGLRAGWLQAAAV
ncbi:RE1 [Symbiodinium sp. CCMP2592]|nr:RE1 [Symbiodinium sp. CCMP2592]